MKLIRRIFYSQLARGSLLVFMGTNIGNFLNFLYNLIIGRLLGPEKYGDLGAIISTISIIGIALSIFSLFTIKQVSSYWGKREKGKIIFFLAYFTPKLFIFSATLSFLLLLLTPKLSNFLHIDSFTPFFIIAVSSIFSGPAILTRSLLQGILAFFYVSINGVIEMSVKLLVSTILVLFNFGLNGALLGYTVAGIISYSISLIELKIIFKGVKKKETHILHAGSFFETLFPVVLTSLIITFFLNADIILVRHFFSASTAGEYVALSNIGRISYYLVGTIISVMFPVISTRVSSGTSYILPLLGTLVASLGLSVVVIFIFFLSPKLILSILYGERFFGIIPYLGIFSFFIAIFSLNSTLTHFLLSISYYKSLYVLFVISLFQGILIFIFHNSILNVIWINIIVSLVYLLVASYLILKKEYKLFPKIIYGSSKTT